MIYLFVCSIYIMTILVEICDLYLGASVYKISCYMSSVLIVCSLVKIYLIPHYISIASFLPISLIYQ